MNRLRWGLLLAAIDAVLVSTALYAALYLRFDGLIPATYMNACRQLAPFFLISLLLFFYIFGLYRRLWQYASVGELLVIVASITGGSLINFLILFLTAREGAYLLPRSILVLHWMITIFFIGFSRLSWRLLRGFLLKAGKTAGGRQILIVGAGDAGATLARELKHRQNQDDIYPVGFVDDNPVKQKMGMFGLPVLGKREDIPALVEEYGIDEIVIAIPSATRSVIGGIVDICQTTGVSLKILPGIYELVNGRVSVSQIREVRVEDILGREPVEVDLASIAGYLSGKTVLVTGAGGSIGSELCRQAVGFGLRRLVALGHGENSIYEICEDLKIAHPDLEVVPVICDIKSARDMNAVFQRHRPEVVFHAAAHKHVPLMELYPAEAVKNNILGTFNTVRAADDHLAEVFVLISTDKAVNPSSMMGATKRIAEMIVQQAAQKSRTRFAAVRFGNVLESRGSVVPLFKKQIASGGPVTVTHAEMVRYFMTIPEAAQLVIQAGALVRGGEIFVLDMGEPVKIVSLARQMIRLAGYRPEQDIPIVFTGIRPGEKLFEEILTSAEGVQATLHQSIFVARPDGFSEIDLKRLLQNISSPGWNGTRDEAIAFIKSLLPDFPQCSGGEGYSDDLQRLKEEI